MRNDNDDDGVMTVIFIILYVVCMYWTGVYFYVVVARDYTGCLYYKRIVLAVNKEEFW